jgi:hypothetical protein
MNLRSILQHPVRVAAAVVAAGLLFGAGTAAGSAAGSEGAQPDTTQPGRDVPVASSAADADTLYHYLGTLPPAERAQTIIALNPNVRGALEAIVAGNEAAANTR